jgi:hypothetical protein
VFRHLGGIIFNDHAVFHVLFYNLPRSNPSYFFIERNEPRSSSRSAVHGKAFDSLFAVSVVPTFGNSLPFLSSATKTPQSKDNLSATTRLATQ